MTIRTFFRRYGAPIWDVAAAVGSAILLIALLVAALWAFRLAQCPECPWVLR